MNTEPTVEKTTHVAAVVVQRLMALLGQPPDTPNALDKAIADAVMHGTGYLRIGHTGDIEHVPYAEREERGLRD